MMPVQLGVLVFGAIAVVLLAASVVREREVPTDGSVGRGTVARGLTALLVVLMVAAAVIVIVRFAQIAIWE